MKALRYSGKVGHILLGALSGWDPAWALPAAQVLDCLDAWVRLGFLHTVNEHDGVLPESEQDARLTRAAITDMFNLAANAMHSNVPGRTLLTHGHTHCLTITACLQSFTV